MMDDAMIAGLSWTALGSLVVALALYWVLSPRHKKDKNDDLRD
jgi:hypothetical protein